MKELKAKWREQSEQQRKRNFKKEVRLTAGSLLKCTAADSRDDIAFIRD